MARFYSCFSNPMPSCPVDCSNKYEMAYLEIAPYTVNPNTGEVLNKNPFPIIVEVGNVNVYEKIQSYAKECDLYSLLNRVVGHEELLPRVDHGEYLDISQVPTSKIEMVDYLKKSMSKFNALDPDLQNLITSSSTDTELIDYCLKVLQSQNLIEPLKKESETNV